MQLAAAAPTNLSRNYSKSPSDDARAARLRELFGLTPAEVRITLLLNKGLQTREVAATLDISVNTVRSHLRNIFVKSEVGGRAALKRLVNETT